MMSRSSASTTQGFYPRERGLQMPCRHDFSNGSCKRCYPNSGWLVPGPEDVYAHNKIEGAGAVTREEYQAINEAVAREAAEAVREPAVASTPSAPEAAEEDEPDQESAAALANAITSVRLSQSLGVAALNAIECGATEEQFIQGARQIFQAAAESVRGAASQFLKDIHAADKGNGR